MPCPISHHGWSDMACQISISIVNIRVLKKLFQEMIGQEGPREWYGQVHPYMSTKPDFWCILGSFWPVEEATRPKRSNFFLKKSLSLKVSKTARVGPWGGGNPKKPSFPSWENWYFRLFTVLSCFVCKAHILDPAYPENSHGKQHFYIKSATRRSCRGPVPYMFFKKKFAARSFQKSKSWLMRRGDHPKTEFP